MLTATISYSLLAINEHNCKKYSILYKMEECSIFPNSPLYLLVTRKMISIVIDVGGVKRLYFYVVSVLVFILLKRNTTKSYKNNYLQLQHF